MYILTINVNRLQNYFLEQCTDPLWSQMFQNRSNIREMISSVRVPSGEYLGDTGSDRKALQVIQVLAFIF